MEIKLNEIQDCYNDIINWLQDYKKHTNCKGVVIGISGGKDSTVVAMLAKKVWDKNVFGILMPNGKQTDIQDSIDIANALQIEHRIVNIETVYNSILHVIENRLEQTLFGKDFVPNCSPISNKAKTNIPPRIRMTVLYAVAQSLGYRVIGTGNASEAYIGWTTKWGDGAYDFNPIAHLTCSEVIALGELLAQEYGLDLRYIKKTPTDGLCGKSDEDSFGFTYSTLDKYISGSETIDYETALTIENMHRASTHKRSSPATMQ